MASPPVVYCRFCVCLSSSVANSSHRTRTNTKSQTRPAPRCMAVTVPFLSRVNQTVPEPPASKTSVVAGTRTMRMPVRCSSTSEPLSTSAVHVASISGWCQRPANAANCASVGFQRAAAAKLQVSVSPSAAKMRAPVGVPSADVMKRRRAAAPMRKSPLRSARSGTPPRMRNWPRSTNSSETSWVRSSR